MDCVQSNNMQIISGQPGKNPYYSTLSSYHIVLPVNAANSVTDYSGAETIFRFWIGNKEQNVDVSNLVITPSSGGDITYTAINEVGGKGVVITVTNVNDSVDSQEIVTIKYVLGGVTYEQDYALNKSHSMASLDNSLESSYVDYVSVQPMPVMQLARAVRVPAGMLKSSGDFLDFKVQVLALDQSIVGDLGTSYVELDINGLVICTLPYYSECQTIVRIRIDYNNSIMTIWVEQSYTFSSEVVNTEPCTANSKFFYTNVDWSVDNFINVKCFLDSASISPNTSAFFQAFQLSYKHNLNTH